MTVTKPVFETVVKRTGFSWRYRILKQDEKRFEWHYHEEYEIALHRNMQGTAYIGSSRLPIEHDQLVLIGSKLPHTFTALPAKGHKQCETHVIFFSASWIENLMYHCPEMRVIKPLLSRAKQAVLFSTQTSQEVIRLLENLCEQTALNQLAIFFQILSCLAKDVGARNLLSWQKNQSVNIEPDEKDKVLALMEYISEHYHEEITIETLARHTNLSVSSIQRLFRLHIGESYSDYLKKLRLGQASELLQKTSTPISLIAERVGYRNLSNFNRQFKAYRGQSPREYRRTFGTPRYACLSPELPEQN